MVRQFGHFGLHVFLVITAKLVGGKENLISVPTYEQP